MSNDIIITYCDKYGKSKTILANADLAEKLKGVRTLKSSEAKRMGARLNSAVASRLFG